MASYPETALPSLDERVLPEFNDDLLGDSDGPYVVILYNDDYHSMDEVVAQLQKATGYNFDRCIGIMAEAHTRGRSIAYTGSETACDRAASILRQIRLQVETDRF